jgi:2-polyprenyl-3-methyl-5-hydroxy-6-metoxy-1,4-benzoquinol methylase
MGTKHSRHQSYYEDYWDYRKAKGRIHTRAGMWIPQRIKIAVEMIQKAPGSKNGEQLSLLDIGCGEGTLGKLLQEKLKNKYYIIGCDISESAIELASDYYDIVYRVDAENVGLPNEFDISEFDFIILLDVLEHLYRPENVLSHCHNILKEKGSLIVSFPNIAWYKYRIQLMRGHFPDDYLFGAGDHIHQFTLHSFLDLLQNNNFQPGEVDGRFIIPGFFRPRRIFLPMLKKFPNLFGYQIVVRCQKTL